jgi:zinc protease
VIAQRRAASALGAVAVLTALSVAQPAFALKAQRIQLDSGAILLVSEQHQLPMITMTIAFDAGARRDPDGAGGLAALTADSLTEGTKDLSAEQLNQKIDFMGSAVGIDAGQDYAGAHLTALKRYWHDTLHLLASMLREPGLRNADIQRKQAETIAGLKSREEQPGYVASVAFSKTLFGSAPYGHPADGTVETVSKLTSDNVRSFYSDHYRMGSAVIVVVGDITVSEARAAIEKELSGPAGTVAPQATPAAPTVATGAHATTIDRNVTQANLILGFGGVARSNPDYYKLQVMNYILGGGGFSSRLVKAVRSKAGLAYSIGSAFEAAKFPGSFHVGLQTKNSSANQAIRLVLEQLRDIQKNPVADAELGSAKKFLIGSFPLKIDRQSAIANFLTQVEVYGLGLDYAERYPKLIGVVTKEDVQRVAREYLHPDAYLLIAVANQSEAGIDATSGAQ